MLPETIKNSVEKLLDVEILESNAIGGGSINQAVKIETGDKRQFFLKWNASAPPDMFPKEKKGLELLASAETELRIPKVIVKTTEFLLIEFIEEGRSNSKSGQQFGQALAALHEVTAEQYGLEYDNYIGRLSQSNDRHEKWIDFFIEERLEPQIEQAVNSGELESKTFNHSQKLYKKLPGLLPEEPPSLLHGDLWGGNYFYDEEGRAVVFDPAVYYGNREIEIAFTHLFDGFSSDFYEAYEQAFPLQPNFNERKDIYNLYPLLVHTNMFGGHYGRQVESIVERFV